VAAVVEPTAAVRRIALAALVACAASLCLYYGRFGLNRLDQSIVFDGGWRILTGQLPFRDFTTPIAVVPSAMQALFFAVFDVSWFSYCLHAAAVNAAFACVAFAVTRRAGGAFWTAWFVGFGSAIVFYTPFSTPFSEQHSFFFSICCLWSAAVATDPTPRARVGIALAPSFAALAFLSKQMPAAPFVAPLLVVVAVLGIRRHPRLLAAGIAAPIAVIAGYLVAVRASWHEVVLNLVLLPLRTASSRTALTPFHAADTFWPRVEHLSREVGDLSLRTPPIVAAMWLAAALTALAWMPTERRSGRPVWLLLLSIWMAAVTALFVYVTNNAAANGLALLPLVVVFAWRSLEGTLFARPSFALARGLVALAVVTCAAIDLWRFHVVVNVDRVMTLYDNRRAHSESWSPTRRLRYLRMNDIYRPFDLRDIIPYIASRPDNFLLLGEPGLLYGTMGHPSIYPALWQHSGLTSPRPDSPDFRVFEDRLMAAIAKYRVRYVIEEGPRRPMGPHLDDLQRLRAALDGCPQSQVDDWTVREICHQPR
jgi:hypothetical protein